MTEDGDSSPVLPTATQQQELAVSYWLSENLTKVLSDPVLSDRNCTGAEGPSGDVGWHF